MKQYKGYYIDKVIFHNEEEIDRFLKDQAVDAYKLAVRLFVESSTMEHSDYATDKADILVNRFGFTWDEVEALEIETMEAMN